MPSCGGEQVRGCTDSQHCKHSLPRLSRHHPGPLPRYHSTPLHMAGDLPRKGPGPAAATHRLTLLIASTACRLNHCTIPTPLHLAGDPLRRGLGPAAATARTSRRKATP